MRGIPALARQFARLRIVDRRVQDRNAHVAVFINIRVPHFGAESKRRRTETQVPKRELMIKFRHKKPVQIQDILIIN